MTITVEELSINMLGKLFEIEKQCFMKDAFSKKEIAYLIEDSDAVSKVAKIGNEIVGFLIGRLEFTKNLPTGHIMTIDVVPNYRRRGIAQQLMWETEKIFKQKGAKEIHLEAREDNIAALKLYEKLGYEKISKLNNYYRGAHGFYFQKTL